MIKRILVPLDRSELAEQALAVATALAVRTEAHMTLAAVMVPSEFWSGDPNPRTWERAEEGAARRYLEKIEEDLLEKGISSRSRVGWGPAARTLARFADEEGADVIVMSAHGRAGFSRWVMGSVADKLLRITARPVLLMHPADDASKRPAPKFERILVPLDGSPRSEAVLPLVEKLATQLHASLVLQQSVLPVSLYATEYIPPAEAVEQSAGSAREYLESAAARERAHGIATDVEVDIGVAVDAALLAAKRTGADMIALSTHGWSGPMRWVMGSVADALVRLSPIPVLVVPTKSTQEHQSEAAPKAAEKAWP